ncbi:MAG: cytochrome C oxidase subunit IV family protein [Rhabdochlamydiaceae bacterium]|nr:cytochrome C oxidase subunit IV family protein [Candidatus Amphrikana amoebophyrae]
MELKQSWNTSFKPVVWGLIISFILTLVSYFIASDGMKGSYTLSVILLAFGAAQALVILILHMHIFAESKPRWNLITFLFLILVIFVLVGGTLWIMYNLSYNTMLPGMTIDL